MPKRAIHVAEPSKHPQPQPRRMGVVLWLLLALAVALPGVAVGLSAAHTPAAMGAVLALIALGAQCFELAGWLARRR